MSNRSSDILFQLIQALEKAEKRHFKLYINRSSSKENLKIVQLFDAMDKMKTYDERALLKKVPSIQKSQVSNLKAHLYRQILASLRLLKSSDSIDLQLHEQFDYAHILYKKGLFLHSLRILDKAKETARANQKFGFMNQVLALEKRIESLHITRSMENRAEMLSEEATQVSRHIEAVARLSNLALQLYSWYIKNGHSRNEDDELRIRQFMKMQLPEDTDYDGFYERLYLYQSYCWYAFIRQDFLMYYRYARKWVELFDDFPLMKRVETGHYIKGFHNLLNAHFDLRNHRQLAVALTKFEAFSQTERVQANDNFRVQCFMYTAQARINSHFLMGSFMTGLKLVPEIEAFIEENHLFIDSHRIMVFNYKIACMYFGSGDFGTAVDYLQRIMNDRADLRYDLQCYARLLHLLAHYELGNDELMEPLGKSVYRFMSKMENLTVIDVEVLKFLRRSSFMTKDKTRDALERFLKQVKQFEKNRFHTRVFAYLDIISWVESKLSHQPLDAVIRGKYEKDRRKVAVA